jgi:hypothetical protein
MIAAMPANTANEPLPTAPSRKTRLAIVVTLIVFSAFELWDAWCTPLPDAAERSTSHGFRVIADLAGQSLLGFGALAFALFGRVRTAIVLLAANIIMRWLTMNTFDPSNWRVTNLWSAQETVMNLIVMPVSAMVAARLAVKNSRLGLATFLVCLPTLYIVVIVIGFAISVAQHGF